MGRSLKRSLTWAAVGLSLAALLIAPARGLAAPAGAGVHTNSSTATNLWLTGHDLDYHCGLYSLQCNAYKLAVNFVRGGSTLPLLILDEGTETTAALSNAFGGSVPAHVVMNPVSQFPSAALLNLDGSRKYSAIITASDYTCGGCDNGPADISAINARKADIAAAANKGTGILALAGADNRATYYSFVPLVATGVAVSRPFHYTAYGLGLGLIEGTGSASDDNCCATHNSFNLPSAASQYKVAELDNAGKAETLVAQGVSVTGGGSGLTGSTATLALHAQCTNPAPTQTVVCGNVPTGCLITPGPACTQTINVTGACVKDALSVTSGAVSLGSGAGSFLISGLSKCSVVPFPTPVSDVACVLAKAFCYGALLDITGTGTLAPASGSGLPSGKFGYDLNVVDDDSGVAVNDSNIIKLTISIPGTPYIAGWNCFPLHGTELGDCTVEVTAH